MALIDNLVKYGVPKQCSVDDVIVMQGDMTQDFYIVAQGKLGVYINSTSDYPIRVAEIVSGGFFGEMSVVTGAPRTATIIAEESSLLFVFSKEKFQTILIEAPDIAMGIIKTLCQRVSDLNGSILALKQHAIRSSSNGTSTEKSPIEGMDFVSLLPKNHPTYDMAMPETFENCVIEKPLTCPVCNEGFSGKIPLFSKLKLKSTTLEFRRNYHDFDILWFTISVCPHCNYADFYSVFNQSSIYSTKSANFDTPTREPLKTAGGDAQKISFHNATFSEKVEKLDITTDPKNIQLVLKSYYLALICSAISEAGSLHSAKLWLRLYWLYTDMDDMTQMKNAAQMALSYYLRAFGEESMRFHSLPDTMELYQTAAELAIFLKDAKTAKKYCTMITSHGSFVNVPVHAQATEALMERIPRI